MKKYILDYLCGNFKFGLSDQVYYNCYSHSKPPYKVAAIIERCFYSTNNRKTYIVREVKAQGHCYSYAMDEDYLTLL